MCLYVSVRVCVCCTNHASMFIINFIALIWINCDINDKQSVGQGRGARRRPPYSPPRHTPVLNPLPPPLSLSVQMMTLKLELHLQALIALIVSYLIGVGGQGTVPGAWGEGGCRGRGEEGTASCRHRLPYARN